MLDLELRSIKNLTESYKILLNKNSELDKRLKEKTEEAEKYKNMWLEEMAKRGR